MDNLQLLVTSIILLYRESQLPGANENSATIVRSVLANIKAADLNIGIGSERDMIDGLKATAMSMCDSPPGYKFDQGSLLQRLKVNTIDNEKVFNLLYDGIASDLPDNLNKSKCLEERRNLNEFFKQRKFEEIIKKASHTMKFHSDKMPPFNNFVADIATQLEQFTIRTDTKDPAIISEVDFDHIDQITNVFTAVSEEAAGTALLKSGYQGINLMLDGGFRRGESVVIGALQHQFKTGFSLSVFKQLALYNIPQMTDPTKKPLMIRISFEDPLSLNFQFLYQSLKSNEVGESYTPIDSSEGEMAGYVRERLQSNGYYVKFLHVNPSGWTYKDICNYIIQCEADGYEVHVCMLDYLLKLPTTGCDQGPMGHDIRNLYERLTNFMKARRILFITPHQLSPEAKKLVRLGSSDLVRELPGKGFYSGSSQIDQVVDLEIYIHIEQLNGKSYLTIQRGKHRKIKQTPFEHQYCVLEFNDYGIPDDINGADTTRTRVGGGPKGTKDEIPFWE